MVNPFDMKKLMEAAKSMQQQMQHTQQQLKEIVVVGSAAGGLVKSHVNGLHQTLRVDIDSSLLSDKDMLEDLIAVAFNDASKKIEEIIKEKMGQMAQGMQLPEE